MKLSFQDLDLPLIDHLSISYESVNTLNNIVVRLEALGHTGWGEASPHSGYGETQETVTAVLKYLETYLQSCADPLQFTDILDSIDQRITGNAATKAAIDMALYDLVGKILGVPVYGLIGLDREKTTDLTYTIGLDTVDNMVEKAISANHYKYLKVKLGTPYDKEIIKEISQATTATIRADVNGGWEARHAIRFINDVLVHYPVEFVEQPLAVHDRAGLKLLYQYSALPIVLDESISGIQSILAHADCTDGVNIKLMKCGGIHTALRMIHTARSLGLKVMLGCRVETTLAITAAVHLSPLVDFADLDLHLLLETDPFVGATLDATGQFVLPDKPGLGVSIKPDSSLATWLH